MLIGVNKIMERLLNKVHVMYSILLVLTTLLLYLIYILSSVITEILYYALYWQA